MLTPVIKQPHQITVVSDDSVQGQMKSQQQRVEFCDNATSMVELSSFSFVPPFTMSDQTDSNKPVKSFRLRGITASVFENSSEDGKSTFFKVTLQRSYKQDDDWKSTNSFGRDDLPIVSLLTKQAWEFILNTEANGQKEEK
ncbi:hypothetical protein [Gimesia aquarii]|uniref:Uncharacterized protein n=1 Tax=Gimesia aquarii TaxID=2527964 RepID=A0A517X071_9PLAN|nr:hypothetical protein [Gimesia aquarii]QDU10903.1 hypothetical protein V202x_43160 [Gimesia aquarii]